MRRHYPRPDALKTCRAALRRGHLTREPKAWSFGRRRFSFWIVRQLIDAGEAVRIEDHVVAWRATNA